MVTPPARSAEYTPHMQQLARYARALCTVTNHCTGRGAGPREETVDLCVAHHLLDASIDATWLYDGIGVYVDEQALQEVEAYLATTCNNLPVDDDVWAHITTLPLVGTLAVNEPCVNDMQCADGGGCYATGGSDTGPVCLAPTQTLGMFCEESTDCVRKPGERVLCTSNSAMPDATCRTWDYPRRGDVFERCGNDVDGAVQYCKSGLSCERGLCAQPTAAGGACGGSGNYACAPGLFCLQDEHDNPGVCAKPVFLSEGASCDTRAADGPYCSLDQHLLCDKTTQTCIPTDVACIHDADCGLEGGVCGENLRCEPPRPSGSECWRDLHCDSKRCDFADWRASPGSCAP